MWLFKSHAAKKILPIFHITLQHHLVFSHFLTRAFWKFWVYLEEVCQWGKWLSQKGKDGGQVQVITGIFEGAQKESSSCRPFLT
jgi:hypothetical protein